jgi:phenylacetate-CoA ligase
VSRDFAESLREDPATGDIRIRVLDPGEGPFARLGAIKNTYLVRTR